MKSSPFIRSCLSLFCLSALFVVFAAAQAPKPADIPAGPGEEPVPPAQTAAQPAAQPAPTAGQPTPDAVETGRSAEEIEKELQKEAGQTEEEEGRLVANFVMERGFFIASDVGIFFTFGGARGYSNIQPYVGLNVGYDLNKWLSLQLSLGNGYSAGNAPTDTDRSIIDGLPNTAAIPNYSLTNIGLAVLFSWLVQERLALEFKAGAGLTNITPLPRGLRGGMPDKESRLDGNVVAGVAIKYLTLMTDFIVGIDLTGYFVIPAGIPALTISPTVRYTF